MQWALNPCECEFESHLDYMAFKKDDRIVVLEGVHKNKTGRIQFIQGGTASVKFDAKHHGGVYYVGTDNMMHEK